jgi:hypothetical protein
MRMLGDDENKTLPTRVGFVVLRVLELVALQQILAWNLESLVPEIQRNVHLAAEEPIPVHRGELHVNRCQTTATYQFRDLTLQDSGP